MEEVGAGCVLETTLAAFGLSCAETCCYDDVVGTLGEDCVAVWGQVGL